jgi:hypothetical protein
MMAMNEMVERVTRAIWPGPFEDDAPGWHQRRDVARDQARAAIAAMRDPTDAMRHAISTTNDDIDRESLPRGLGPHRDWWNDLHVEHGEWYWRAMIDAALR